jgi:predicted transcriptional regulator
MRRAWLREQASKRERNRSYRTVKLRFAQNIHQEQSRNTRYLNTGRKGETMTYEEELAWAQTEHQARITDLQDRTPEGLRRAQENAERRRKAAGLSRSQAASLVHEAGRVRRSNEMGLQP